MSTRRHWLASQAGTLAALAAGLPRLTIPRLAIPQRHRGASTTPQTGRHDPTPWATLVQQAVAAAREAGAQYADARVTRRTVHKFTAPGHPGWLASIALDEELVGIGVRALVNGYWGFSASTVLAADEGVRLAKDAVSQAGVNAKGSPPWTVDLGSIPVATGTWVTPHRIDPFTVTIEEKIDFITNVYECMVKEDFRYAQNEQVIGWTFRFVKEERVVATSEGALFTQTLLESGGHLMGACPNGAPVLAHGIDPAGAGWELILDANLPEQFLSGQLCQESRAKGMIPSKPCPLGRYTIVADGATTGRLLEATLGTATQLDRALGYEANARGTSFIDDPLQMVGNLQVSSPLMTMTANRSAPRELATVQWDDEGVRPEPFTLIKEGVLVDFQTTREQAAWLAPYYQQHGQPVRSHGCAAAESAHYLTMQHMPNLALAPSASDTRLEQLIGDVPDGILMEGGIIRIIDAQARTGELGGGTMRQIKNGKLGAYLVGSTIRFNSPQIWKTVQAVGGPSTEIVIGTSGVLDTDNYLLLELLMNTGVKGQPPQRTGRSIRAAATVLPNLPVLNPSQKV